MPTKPELEEELYQLKKRGEPAERVLAHLVGLEAAIGILHKHNLLVEWADAVARINVTREDSHGTDI